jgi:hypothetical protein
MNTILSFYRDMSGRPPCVGNKRGRDTCSSYFTSEFGQLETGNDLWRFQSRPVIIFGGNSKTNQTRYARAAAGASDPGVGEAE